MNWLTAWRLKVYSRAIVAVYAAALVGITVGGPLTGKGLYSLQGIPLGSDFLGFWSAARLAADGHPAWAYNLDRVHALEKLVISPAVPPIPWLYPPTFLLLVLPLALLPYLPAMLAWLALTLAAYLGVVWRIAPLPLAVWLTLAFPGTFQNLIHFQNGFLSAAFLGGGLLLAETRPFAGGVLLGLLSYKPHLAVLALLALIAGRRWWTLAGAAVGAGGLALATLPLMGWETWRAFLQNLPLAGWMIEHGAAPLDKMTTTFTGVLLAGAGYPAAASLQGVVAVSAAVAVAWVWRRDPGLPWRGSALAIGVLLATPYAFEYDLAILALPLAWLAWEGYGRGWRPGEQAVLLLGWLVPLAAPMLAAYGHVQITPLVLGALLWLVLRRTARLPAQVR